MKFLISLMAVLTLFASSAFSMNSVELAKYASDRTVHIDSIDSAGTGCIISPDGLIITNYHVAGDKKDLFIILDDGRIKKATVLAKGDRNADVALIKIDATDLPYFNYGNSDVLVRGQEVMVVGYPYSLGKLTTFGHITGLNITSGMAYNDTFYIVTDAAINPGNSGGGLIDFEGNLVGINTAVYQGNNVGFALPINDIIRWIEQIKKDKKATFVMLGLTLGRIGIGDNENLEVPDGMVGVVVDKVEKGSPAYKAGIKRDDVIIDIGGIKSIDPTTVKAYIYQKSPGTIVHMTIYRDGKYLIKDVKLGAHEKKESESSTGEATPNDPTGGLDKFTPHLIPPSGIVKPFYGE